MDRPLIFLDTETATLAGAPHLLEVGAVRVVRGDAVEHFERLVRPQVPIDADATRIHGIDEAAVLAADTADIVLAELTTFVGDDWMGAHRAEFDARVLGFEYARVGLEPPAGPVLDTLALARAVVTDAPDCKLGTLVDHLGIDDAGTAHRALPDAVACWQVFEACVERLGGHDQLSEADLVRLGGVPTTIESAGPAPPGRPRAVVRALQRALRDGESVDLLYGDDTSAPVTLGVRPGLLYRSRERGYLEGECLSTGILKTYRLDRVKRVLRP